MTITSSRLSEIGKRCLNNKGQSKLDDLLNDGETQKACEYILGALDYCWQQGSLTSEQVQNFQSELGISPERASRLRQMTSHEGRGL
jgi:hypothetical protein